MSSRPGGAGGYLHWQKYQKRKAADALRHRRRLRARGSVHRAAEAAGRSRRDGGGGRSGRRSIRIVKAASVDLYVPADAEIVIEGLIDSELLEPEGPFGESHGHVALEDFNMSMQVTAITHKRAPVFVSIISQVTPSELSVMKKVAFEPMFLAHLRDQLGDTRDQGVGCTSP